MKNQNMERINKTLAKAGVFFCYEIPILTYYQYEIENWSMKGETHELLYF